MKKQLLALTIFFLGYNGTTQAALALMAASSGKNVPHITTAGHTYQVGKYKGKEVSSDNSSLLQVYESDNGHKLKALQPGKTKLIVDGKSAEEVVIAHDNLHQLPSTLIVNKKHYFAKDG